MSQIKCETAAQCEQLAETMNVVIPQAIAATLAVLVVGIALYVGYREVSRYHAA